MREHMACCVLKPVTHAGLAPRPAVIVTRRPTSSHRCRLRGTFDKPFLSWTAHLAASRGAPASALQAFVPTDPGLCPPEPAGADAWRVTTYGHGVPQTDPRGSGSGEFWPTPQHRRPASRSTATVVTPSH